MDKQKVRPLDEERESRSLLSNVVVILHLILGTLPILLVVWAVDKLMNSTLSPIIVWGIGGIMILLAMLRGVFYGTSIWRAHRSAYNALTRLRLRIISHLQRLPLGFFQERKVGDLVNIINHDVEQIEIYLAHGLPEILSATLFPALLWVIIMVLDWRLGLSLISLLPVAFLLQMAVKTLWGKSFQHFMESTQKMSEDLLEYVATISVIKAFSNEENRTERVLGGMRDYIRWVKRSMFSVTVPMTLITMFLEGGIVVMTLIGLWMMSSGELTVARFILALILGGLFSSSFAKLATFQHFRIIYGQSLAKVQSITEVQTKETADKKTDTTQTDVCFEHVTFSYPNKKDNALKDVCLQFPRGSHTAIVGESGSGKTTLVSLLQHIYPIQAGRISIGQYDIAMISNESLRRFIGIVPQKVELFSGTLLSNICLGDLQPDMRRVLDIITQLGLKDFVDALPKGLDTIVSEQGTTFSGGERQRIAIARALYKQPEVLIFDEATSSLDSISERFVKQTLHALAAQGKTIIVIAHRLSTIKDADRIVVIDKGEVAECGTHSELIAQNGVFQRLWHAQTHVID